MNLQYIGGQRRLKVSFRALLTGLLLAGCVSATVRAQLLNQDPVHTPNPIPASSTGLDRGYFDMYDVHFGDAHKVFEQILLQHPDDALAAASDAAAYLFGEFDRLHIIDVELFADQNKFDSRGRLNPDPGVRKSFDDRCAQANRLADALLQRNARDATALYVKTLIAGMQSDYALMIDKRDITALNLSKQASGYSRAALQVQPHMFDAYLASGVENYMLSLKAAPVRWLLSITGAGTNKAEGIRLLTLTANQGHYLAPFARMMLSVAALRENHPQVARALLIALAREYPDNTLYQRQLDRIH